MLKRCLLVLSIVSVALCLRSQDPYFTQFFAAPLELNPALTGAIEGSFRVSAAYRDQWSGLTDQPYRTFGAFGDVRFSVGQRGEDYVGAGISFIGDKVPAFDFNTNMIKLSGAFHKNLSDRSRQYLSGGVYMGLAQRNVNIEQLFFNDQFNGLDGYTFTSGEVFPENNFAYLDLGLGINYSVSPSDRTQLNLGGAIAHITEPSSSFGTRTEEVEVPDIPLYARYTAYASASFTVADPIRILPRLAFFQQGPHTMLNFGTNVRFEINQYNNNAMQVGAGLRLANDIGSLAPSALYIVAGIELGSFLLGVNYDFNLDDLTNERLGQGVIEFNVTYIGEYENNATFCPTF